MKRFENFGLLGSAEIIDAYVGRYSDATLGLIAESKEGVISELLDILEMDINDGEDYIMETIESIREVLNARVDICFGKGKIVIY